MSCLTGERSFGLDGLKILLVEDDFVNQIVVSKMLKLRNIKVVCASNGFEATDIYRRDNDFDVILMDIQLPGMDGIKTTSEIRKIQEATGKKVSVIALTAYVADGSRDYFISMGLDDYAVKPVDFDYLVEVIKRNIFSKDSTAN